MSDVEKFFSDAQNFYMQHFLIYIIYVLNIYVRVLILDIQYNVYIPVCSPNIATGVLEISGVAKSDKPVSIVSSSENPLLSSPEESCLVF